MSVDTWFRILLTALVTLVPTWLVLKDAESAAVIAVSLITGTVAAILIIVCLIGIIWTV